MHFTSPIKEGLLYQRKNLLEWAKNQGYRTLRVRIVRRNSSTQHG